MQRRIVEFQKQVQKYLEQKSQKSANGEWISTTSKVNWKDRDHSGQLDRPDLQKENEE